MNKLPLPGLRSVRLAGGLDRVRRPVQVKLDRLARKREVDLLRLAVGQQRNEARDYGSLRWRDAEMMVFSQAGEDGLIQWLLHNLAPVPNSFAELGVGDYSESNTRFLLLNDNWSGLIVNAGDDHVRFAAEAELDWQRDLTVVSDFVTVANASGFVARFGDQLGLLSIDLDGVDYWIWEAITARPAIVIHEYNAVFGATSTVTVPYRDDFVRERAHWSNCYFGASLGALHHLGRTKGYSLVGCDSTGNNAFFVRDDLLNDRVAALRPEEAFVKATFCDTRDPDGNLSFVRDHADRRWLMADLPLVDVVTGRELRVSELAV